MHIVVVVPSYASDESSGFPALRSLVRELAQHVSLDVIAMEHPRVQATWRDDRARIHALGAGNDRARVRIKRAFELLVQIDRDHKIDLLHGIWLYEPGLVATLAARLLRCPTIASIGGAEIASIPQLDYGGLLTMRGRAVAREVLRTATLVSGGSDWICQIARRVSPGLLPDRLVRIPLPVDVEAFQLDPGVSRPDRPAPSLLQVGSYIPVKGHRTTIDAFTAFARQMPESRLVMAGEDPVGMRQKLADLVRDRGLSDRVQLLDRVPQRRVAELHQEADIFVFPSWHESQGLAALEAAASGIPIIGSNVGIVSDLAPHRAVAIEPGNAGELAESILRLWDDQDLVNSMKQNGRSWVDRFATPEASAHRFIDQYRRLTSAYR